MSQVKVLHEYSLYCVSHFGQLWGRGGAFDLGLKDRWFGSPFACPLVDVPLGKTLNALLIHIPHCSWWPG